MDLKDLQFSAREAFSGMRTLYRPDDEIHVDLLNGLFPFVRYTAVRFPEKDPIWGRTGAGLTFESDGYTIRGETLFVHPKYQGNGYGRELVQGGERFLRNLGFRWRAVRSSDSAERFWEHMGYVKRSDGYFFKEI